VGVVETKQLRVMGMGATANLFLFAPKVATWPLVRLDGRAVRQGLEEVDTVWARLAPTIAIERQFADEVLAASLSVFDVVGTAFRCVAGLALAIALMGLAGMSLHIIGRRTHEIGVRKTLGATAGQILRLLFVDFSKPVLIANVLAWPLAFLAVRVLL